MGRHLSPENAAEVEEMAALSHTAEDTAFIELYRQRLAEAKKATHADGSPATPENRLSKEENPSYHKHHLYNERLPGQVCLVCELQRGVQSFKRDLTREGSRANICQACQSKYEDLVKPAAAVSRRRIMKKKIHQVATREARNYKKVRKAQKKLESREQMAVRELAQRKLARERLLPFIQRFNEKYEAGWVHRAICKRLEKFSRDVANRKSPRLMIFMPPRAGKSEIASKTFPAWHLGHYPEHEIIASSYAVSLPLGFSRKVKDLITSASYKQVFPKTALSKTSQAAEAWLTTKGGGYVAAGVGTGITGKGAHVAIVDDPVKDAEEADSETQRQKVWDWYSSTLYTRLAPGGGVLVIQTRWHDDDLSGRLIRRQKEREQELTEEIERVKTELAEPLLTQAVEGALRDELAQLEKEYDSMERWDILVFPQEATADEYYHPAFDMFYDSPDHGRVLVRKKGEPLHPARFNERMIIRMKQTMEPRHWSALHQQNPVPEEGEIFTKSMFRYEPTLPDWRQWDLYMAGDLALGSKQSNDWTVLLVGAMDFEGQLHIIDMSRFKGGADPIIENTIALLKRYEKRMVRFGLEQGQIQMAIWPELLRKIKEEKIAVSFAEGQHALKPVSDKVARARTAQAMMQQGRIIYPSNQPWLEDLQTELMRFPGGLNDDIVDALAWLAKMTNKVSPPTPAQHRKVKSWRDKVNGYARNARMGGGHLNA